MKSTKNILLIIGSAGLAPSFFGLINGDAFTEHLIGLICGSSLILGYFDLKKKEVQNC